MRIKILIITLILGALLLSGCEAITIIQSKTTPGSTSQTTQNSPLNTSSSLSSSAPPVSSPLPTPTSTTPVSSYQPTGEEAQLFQYLLDLINSDRQVAGLNPVVLNYNAAAQKHARDMLDNFYLSHWGTDGLKPYMRFTLAGGINYEQENSAYSGWFNPKDNPASYRPMDTREEIKHLQWAMLNDDASSNWGHRENILNKWHQKVNLGIAYNDRRLAMVQQFEGDYIEFTLPPTLTGNLLSLSGKYTLGKLNNISIYYDEFPQKKTGAELLAGPHSYSLGENLSYILPAPPPGQYYTNLPPQAILAQRWDLDESGRFTIQADISPALSLGKGVYTIVIVTTLENHPQPLTNYSLFVE